MRAALLLVDLQRDYLDRPGLVPAAAQLLPAVALLLREWRARGLPVFHAHTLVDADGADAMPHWRRRARLDCVRGTPGAQAAEAAAPLPGEAVFCKTHFSAFGNPGLPLALAREGIDTLLIAGLYTHACVRASALDAYQAGLSVRIATDAVASCETAHARISLDYLDARSIAGRPVKELLAELRAPGTARGDGVPLFMRNPCDWEKVVGEHANQGPAAVDAAVGRAADASGPWAAQTIAARAARLRGWADRLEARRDALAQALVRDLGKPLADARAEVDYGLRLLRQGLSLAADEESTPGGTRVRYRPHGVVAAITPWNNPFSLALGKIAPAMLHGNTVVWKPAPAGTGIADRVLEAMREAGLAGMAAMVSGDGATGAMLAAHPDIAAVSFTGSCAAGRHLAALCATANKPLQAELGGNNAVVVLADVEPEAIADELALAMFSFSGQRCTAPRRVIVEAPLLERLTAALRGAVLRLPIGMPEAATTVIGPLITRDKRDALLAAVQGAVRDGATLVCGGEVPHGYERGCWMAPTLLAGLAAEAPLLHEESFGPLALIQRADDHAHAFALANAGRHGLVASLYSGVPERQQGFLRTVRAGMLSLNRARPDFDPAAPFGGWRDSGIGIAEHGRWDRDFFTRPQAVYGLAGDSE